MKAVRFLLPVLVLSLSTLALAQSEAQKSEPSKPQSEAQKSFAKLKALEGTWEGSVTTTPPTPEIQGKLTEVSLRVTSMGNAIMHNMRMAGRPDDPITMLYLDEDRLLLTHYCDAGNRPRMTGKISPDGKAVAFDFLDVVGPMQYGHMHNAVFTTISENHHIEEWTYMLPGDKPVRARFELKRKK